MVTSQMENMMKLNCKIVISKEGTVYEPWSDGWAIGFKATSNSGKIEYITLNPSGESDDNVSNVFLYHGTPKNGTPIVFINLFD